MKHETRELPAGAVIHFSGLEGGVSFACGQERAKGDWWSQYFDHITCPKCLAFLSQSTDREKATG